MQVTKLTLAGVLICQAMLFAVAASDQTHAQTARQSISTPTVTTQPVITQPATTQPVTKQSDTTSTAATQTVTPQSSGDAPAMGDGTGEASASNEEAGAPATAGQLTISEFRLFGVNGANDEFVEIYNNTDADLTVATVDGSAGYAVAASDGIVRFVIPTGTTIPARGHFLGVNSLGYSLAAYPAGSTTIATGDATYTTNIPANAGIALFNTANPASFSLATRLDAVGSDAEANTLYREGAGYGALPEFPVNQSMFRKWPGGCHGYAGRTNDDCPNASAVASTPAPASSYPVDTDDNRSDFLLVEPSGTELGTQRRLGAPAPENLTSPVASNARAIQTSNLDPQVGASVSPNRVRDPAGDAGNNSPYGTIDIRKTFTNRTGADLTRLRFRIIDITTFPVVGVNCPGLGGTTDPECVADLRARASSDVVVQTAQGGKTVRGTTLEEAASTPAPANQPGGGGYNSSLSANSVNLITPLADGESINLRFLLGVQQTGKFRFFVVIEALPR